ncbi:MAG: aldehyde ferredoxin oxidoreductase family protein [Desulfitobacteriaceae bacterium]
MPYGYTGKILFIDLTAGTSHTEALDPSFARTYLGGRGFNMRRLYDEAPPEMDPLQPENPLIFGVGPLVGTMLPGSARFNVSGKSPQTGILGDSNAGGFFGPELKFAGYDQVVIKGKSPRPVYLLLTNDKVEIRPAEHLWGKDIWETQQLLLAELKDKRIQISAIGQAAENGVKFAGLFNNLVRAAARTGMGTLMGSKNLKAVVVRGHGRIDVADPTRFLALVKRLDGEIFNHSEYKTRALMGTTKLVHALNEAGCLATRHFQSGRFEWADDVSGETLAETYKTKSKACYSCTIPCSRFYEVTAGPFQGLKSEGPEFEGLAGFSSRVGVNDLGAALKGIDLCNRYGLDVITTSEMISFAMELYQRGILSRSEADGLDLSWGNVETVHTLIHKIAYREGFGDILADGVRAAAMKIGRGSEAYAFHVKGLEFFQADPRGLKAYALGYALASRGGDHLRSEPSFEFSENPKEGIRLYGSPDAAYRLKYRGKGRVVKHYEEWSVLADTLGVCKNTIVNMEVIPFDTAAELLQVTLGWDIDGAEVQQICERIVNLERAYNTREGLSRKDDSLPKRFTEEPLPPESGPSAGSVVELEPMLDEYYEARGWDILTGKPTAAKLKELGLAKESEELLGSGRIQE